MPITIDCFKAYDIRGRVPDQLNEDIAYRIGNGLAQFLTPQRIVLGRDIRLTSQAMADAVTRGLTDAGVDVLDIGLCGTEMVYFGTFSLNADGGVMVTASHNPVDYNGMKLVREQSRPISDDTGLREIRILAQADERLVATQPGSKQSLDISASYIEHLLSYVDVSSLKPLKLVVNAGNGGAGLVIDQLEGQLPFEFVKLQHEPDGHFPNGVPNPLLPENRAITANAVVKSGADMGIAWDGDYDRCFLFDEQGGFIEGYFIVGLLAASFLSKAPGSRIVHDPRLVWNTLEIVENSGGKAVQSKSGHAFIKEKMRAVDAVYGGEMSAHHYFRDFSYCDSGMIPWLLVAELLSRGGQSLSALVQDRMARYPISGEINRTVPDIAATLAAVDGRYRNDALSVDATDGLSFEFPDWRFNLRASNTEPVVRLNVETRADAALLESKTKELLSLIG